MYVVAAAAARVDTAWVDTATFSGAILCFSFDRSRTAYAVAAAVPLFALAVYLGVAPLHAALLTLGCGGVIVLTSCALSGSPLARENVQIAVLLPLFAVATNTANHGIAHLTPHLLDAALLRLDCGISAAIRTWTLARPARLEMANVFYGALPLAVALGIASATGQARYRLLRGLCLAAVLAVPCYFLVPAVGPAHIGEPFAARNCVPSLHLTWAMLVWLNARPVWLRRGTFVFVLLTAFATLATGEHYVLDLILALPFAWVMQQLSKRDWTLRFAVRSAALYWRRGGTRDAGSDQS
jgi:hypothetical protein